MKYINEYFISKNNNLNNEFIINSGLLIYNLKRLTGKSNKSKDFDFNFNQFILYFLENEFWVHDEILNKISSKLRNEFKFYKTKDLNEINKILKI